MGVLIPNVVQLTTMNSLTVAIIVVHRSTAGGVSLLVTGSLQLPLQHLLVLLKVVSREGLPGQYQLHFSVF